MDNQVVVGGCHSLMNVDGVLHGDPLEASALQGIQWAWNATSHTAYPQQSVSLNETVVQSQNETVASASSNKDDDADPSLTPGGKRHPQDEANAVGARGSFREFGSGNESTTEGGNGQGLEEGGHTAGDVGVTVWRRYAFSSQLQRMSVVAEVSGAELTDEAGVPEVTRVTRGLRGRYL